MPGGAVGAVDFSSTPAAKPATARQALPAIMVAAFAAFGGLLFGYDTGTINGMLTMQAWRDQYGSYMDVNPATGLGPAGNYITTSQTSLTTSILSAGTFVGALIGAPLADFFGRRWGLQSSLLIFVVGVILQDVSTALPLFIVGRVVAGLGIGGISTIVPLYQSETAPRWIRGAVVSGYQWFITIGLLIAAIVNNSTKSRSDSGAYRIPLSLQFAWALILSGGLLILPESPRWLVRQGHNDRAAAALAKLNSSDADSDLVRSELSDIQTALDFERSHGQGTYMDCFKGGERKVWFRLMTGSLLQGWQQLTGINFIFYYGTSFFESTTTNTNSAYVFTTVSNVVNVVATIPSFYMMDKFGRRPLLVIGAFYMSACELVVAAIGTRFGSSNPAAQKSLVAFVCLYIAGFASTWGPAAWVVCGEIFPLQIRAKALSLCTASNWLWNFIIGYITPILVDSGSGNADLKSKVFWIWTGTCFLAGVFAYFTVYETKGLSLEEVDRLYVETSPLKSARVNAEMVRQRLDPEAKIADDEQVVADAAKQETVNQTKDADSEKEI